MSVPQSPVDGHVKPRDSDALLSASLAAGHLFFFWRQESASMSRTWQDSVKRSTSAATQAAPGKMVPHCLNPRLVVMMVRRS